MSIFNESNNLASELVLGRDYQSNEPCPRPKRLVFVKGDSTAVVTALEESEEEWACVASIIHRLFNEGYRLGCDMNVSWNGRYDADSDPEPDDNYLPCRKPVSVCLDGRHLCAKHGGGANDRLSQAPGRDGERMKSVRVEMKKNAINKRLDPKQELQKAEMAVAIAQRKNEEEGQHEAEMALAIARRKNGLCIYCGQMNQEAGDGYLGGTCAECLGVSVREMKQMLR